MPRACATAAASCRARAPRGAAPAPGSSLRMSTHGLPPFDPHCAWFLDVDGTLLDIAALPAAVRLSSADKGLVTALFAATGGALALISGRSLGDIDKIFAPLH